MITTITMVTMITMIMMTTRITMTTRIMMISMKEASSLTVYCSGILGGL